MKHASVTRPPSLCRSDCHGSPPGATLPAGFFVRGEQQPPERAVSGPRSSRAFRGSPRLSGTPAPESLRRRDPRRRFIRSSRCRPPRLALATSSRNLVLSTAVLPCRKIAMHRFSTAFAHRRSGPPTPVNRRGRSRPTSGPPSVPVSPGSRRRRSGRETIRRANDGPSQRRGRPEQRSGSGADPRGAGGRGARARADLPPGPRQPGSFPQYLGAPARAAKESDYYTITSFETPDGEVLEAGALELMPDARLAVATRRGEIWMIDAPLAERVEAGRFQRFAHGLHEPLGVDFRDGWL